MKEKLEDTTIFLSDAYKHFLTTMRNGIAEGTSGKATMFRGGKDGAIAYTDGSDTYINYDNCLAEGLERTEKNTLFLNSFCDETLRTWAPLSPETKCVISVKRPWVQVT